MLILGIQLCMLKRDVTIYEKKWQLKFTSFIFLYLLFPLYCSQIMRKMYWLYISRNDRIEIWELEYGVIKVNYSKGIQV